MLKSIFTTIALASLLFFSACEKKPDDKKPDEQPAKKGLSLSFNGMFDGTAMVYKTGEYTRSNGEIVRISNWAFILSKLSLIKSDDSKVTLGDGYLYVDFVGGKTNYHFPAIPFGDYKGISFQLGLDSAVNHGDPAEWAADHPLNGAYTGLHWGWATGYIFQALDGSFKTSPGQFNWDGISLHTAGNDFTKEFTVDFNFTIADQTHKTMQIEAWVDEFFKNPVEISFKNDGSFSHSVGTKEVDLMKKILGNAGDVFKIKEVK